MKILEKLGLSGNKQSDNTREANAPRKPEASPPTRQDMCCGSCGGQGHADKKGGES